jgi:hypothetical protein
MVDQGLSSAIAKDLLVLMIYFRPFILLDESDFSRYGLGFIYMITDRLNAC